MRDCRSAYSINLLMLLIPASMLAQAAKVVRGDPQCGSCRIAAVRLTTLQSSSGPGQVSAFPMSVSTDARGRYIVTASREGDAAPWRFDSSGKFSDRIGRTGSGPGEYRDAVAVLRGPWDSVLVIDRAQPRVSILSPSGTFVRSFPIPPLAIAGAVLPGGQLVINAPINDADRVGLPLHVFDRAGKYQRSFGEAGSVTIPPGGDNWRRWVTSASDGTLWVAEATRRYRLTQWDSGGRMLQVVDVTPSWFKPYERRESYRRDRPPQSTVQGLWLDEQGLLWAVGSVADADFRAGMGPLIEVEGFPVSAITDPDRAFDTIVDVFDVKKGLLVAEVRLPNAFPIVMTDGRLVRVREGDEGYIVEIWNLSLTGARQSDR